MTRPGRVNLALSVFAVATVIVAAGSLSPRPTNDQHDVLVLCSASQYAAVEPVARRHAATRDLRVSVSVGGAGMLSSQYLAARRGDLFVAADRRYLDRLDEMGLLSDRQTAGSMRAIFVTRAGGPRSLDDAIARRSRIALAEPASAAIGRLLQEQLQASGAWTAVDTLVRDRGVYRPTVVAVLNDVRIGAAEAGVIWDAVWNDAREAAPEVEAIETPRLAQVVGRVEVATLATSRTPEAASRLAGEIAEALRLSSGERAP